MFFTRIVDGVESLQSINAYLDDQHRVYELQRDAHVWDVVLFPLTPANNYTPKVIIMGGGSPSTNTTEIIDLSAADAEVGERAEHVAAAPG